MWKTKLTKIYDILLFLLFVGLFAYCMLHPELYCKTDKETGALTLRPFLLAAEILVFLAGMVLLFFRSRITLLLAKFARPLSIAVMVRSRIPYQKTICQEITGTLRIPRRLFFIMSWLRQ